MFLASSPFGKWAKSEIMKSHQEPPQLVGISILHAGQVIPAVATSMIARQLWPDTVIVWGGPHMSGLGNSIKEDIHERSFAADIFVTGHAEKTFVELLNDLACRKSLKRNVRPLVMQGTRGSPVPPVFDNLELYDKPLTLPAQSMLGCAYGRCAFCTYPAIEPSPTKDPLLLSVGSVVDVAHSLRASVSIKDSLVTPLRLEEIATCVEGRVPWSACTKLSKKMDAKSLSMLQNKGLATLEIGLESLLQDTQIRLRKVQPRSLYVNFLRNVAQVPELSIVVNYITGFPWEHESTSFAGLQEAHSLLEQHLGERGQIEHNTFELERLSPMAIHPKRFDLDMRWIKAWPWASVLEHRAYEEKEEEIRENSFHL